MFPNSLNWARKCPGRCWRGADCSRRRSGRIGRASSGDERGGGVVGLGPADYVGGSGRDVAFTTLPANVGDDPRWRKLMESKAQIFVIGRAEDVSGAASVERFAGFTGGVDPGEGLFAMGELKPLAPLRPFEQLVRGWAPT